MFRGENIDFTLRDNEKKVLILGGRMCEFFFFFGLISAFHGLTAREEEENSMLFLWDGEQELTLTLDTMSA